MTNRIYVADLASYNNGILHGAWIDATSDADEMQEKVNEILRASRFPNVMVEFEGKQVPSAEEFAIHDFEGEALKGLREYCGLAAVAARVELDEIAEDELGSDGLAIVLAYWDNIGMQYMPNDIADAVKQVRGAYCGSFSSWTDWAENYCEETGLLDSIPENLRYYFDFEAYGRDARCNGDIFENEGHFFYSR